MKTIGVCASGPSLTLDDCDLLRRNVDEVIAVNDSWRMVRADHLYAADAHWWHYHIKDINCGFTGQRWSCDPPGNTNWCKHDPVAWHINVMECDIGAKGLSTDPKRVHSGGNSGYQAINLALHLGAQRVVLLGYDMHNHSGKSHWFGDHPKNFANRNGNPDRFIAAFRTIQPGAYGLEILNCSRTTALDAFPRVALEEVCAA